MSTHPNGAPVPEAEVVPTPMILDSDTDAHAAHGLHSPPDSDKKLDGSDSDSELSDIDDAYAQQLEEEHAKLSSNSQLDDNMPDAEPSTPTLAPPEAAPASAPEPTPAPAPAREATMEKPSGGIDEILPDHYSGGTVPVFKPTMEQFKDFKIFMEKVDTYGMQSGIIKIIPPQEWKDSLPPPDELVKQIRVKEPIKQDIMGSNGQYRQVNILHQRSYNLRQWRNLCDQSEHQPPARRGERRANADKPKPAPRPRAATLSTTSNPDQRSEPVKRGRGRWARKAQKVATDAATAAGAPTDRPITPISPKTEEDGDGLFESIEQQQQPGDEAQNCDVRDEPLPSSKSRAGRQSKPVAQSVSARRKYIKREGSAKVDEEAFKNWDYQMDISEFTPERCEELERIYWKTLTYAPPLYGADLPGSLFPDDLRLWNLDHLPNLLDVLGTKVPGVNTAYLYLGMWKATFAWHLEDVDLYSINYLHFGAPKQWYSISQCDARRFEKAMQSIWPQEAKACDQFLRHKSFLISPSYLQQHYNIKVNRCISYPGEFVVTYPYGYHSGYNLGYNCAEAVNFALDSWLPMARIAKRCECAQAQDSVWVDVNEIERRLRGDPLTDDGDDDKIEDEDEEDEYDDHNNGEAEAMPPTSASPIKPKARAASGRKRKQPMGGGDSEVKASKKIRLRLKPAIDPPCCLCPNSFPGFDLLPCDNGRKAHRICALYLPETYIEMVDSKEVVTNLAQIDKARLNLKCLFCRSRRGACFQCSQKKCARSYHATCAAAAGVYVEEANVPVFDRHGTEYKELAFEFSCRFHRVKRDRRLDADALDDDARIRAAAAALKPGDIWQTQFLHGDIFAGLVVENRPAERTVLLDVIPHGDRVEVDWKWLLVPHPSEHRLPKASAHARPMPSSRKAQMDINAQRAARDQVPCKDDKFGHGFVWAEFRTVPDTTPMLSVKADLFRENQLWHYLGHTSTESRAQYTQDPANPVHNPRSNFLDSVPRPVVARSLGASTYHPRRAAHPLSQSMTASSLSTPPVEVKNQQEEKPYVYKPRKPANSFRRVSFATPIHEPITTPRARANTTTATPTTTATTTPTAPLAPPPLPPPRTNSVKQESPNSGCGVQSIRDSVSSRDEQQPMKVACSPKYAAAPRGVKSGMPQLLGLKWPPGQAQSGEHNHQPLPRSWSASSSSTATTTSKPPGLLPVPMTSSSLAHATPSGQSQGPGGSGAGRFQKYAFFQVYHNRESTRYRTPYAPWGGFTNGYEGNLRAFLKRAQEALAGAKGNSQRTSSKAVTNPLHRRHRRHQSTPSAAYAPALGSRRLSSGPDGTHTSARGVRKPRRQTMSHAVAPSHLSTTLGAGGAAAASQFGLSGFEGQGGSTSLHDAIRPEYAAPWETGSITGWPNSASTDDGVMELASPQSQPPQPPNTPCLQTYHAHVSPTQLSTFDHMSIVSSSIFSATPWSAASSLHSAVAQYSSPSSLGGRLDQHHTLYGGSTLTDAPSLATTATDGIRDQTLAPALFSPSHHDDQFDEFTLPLEFIEEPADMMSLTEAGPSVDGPSVTTTAVVEDQDMSLDSPNLLEKMMLNLRRASEREATPS